ncbi:MAG TPA: helix-turn-helix transcriptional regulator [Candidatus Sericytochromatia bacterium]
MDYTEARQQFAARLSQLRREKRITQDELAELIDKTTDYISLLERGERSPSFEVILELAEALSVPPSYLSGFISCDSFD